MHKSVIERLTREFGTPRTSLRWTLPRTRTGLPEVTVQVEELSGGPCHPVRVWVFNPGNHAAASGVTEIVCEKDIEGLVEHIRRELAA